ncbi:uncharacterized protein LOC112344956 [Selaginella moellendorffii]|uniref:CLAVATA3/endosperm surrounding region 2 n=1 Tax=Selaginella moellendorffii TaxID=88036 RepID=C0STN0_SELML|nr:uncharacterized protein LOC112344956 [Selaginella moellendorffii]BAH56533.1 CLAVATA3/endosperm surrounding region 2 [Selaginella moellendorffii]|eukprot:XP_024526423.1 uncharacterized protein LOC112344956 [Selaginella moellendorffii]
MTMAMAKILMVATVAMLVVAPVLVQARHGPAPDCGIPRSSDPRLDSREPSIATEVTATLQEQAASSSSPCDADHLCSPPMFGTSKRTVPTGPNPLHN